MIVNANGYGKIVDRTRLIWTNPDPSAEFGEQLISLADENYRILYIMFYTSNTIQNLNTMICAISASSGYDILSAVDEWDLYSREYKFTSKNILFKRGTCISYSGLSDTTTASGNYIIPVYIYGIY